MKLVEAKEKFIQLWGALGSSWGINRTMAQIHALLLISQKPLSTEEIMENLSVSRGNVNMNIRELMNWNLVSKELIPGERREFFSAEKDIWEVAKRIARERKRREIQPLIQSLEQLQVIEETKKNPEAQAFQGTVAQIQHVVSKMDHAVDTMIKAEEHQLFGLLVKLLK
ncbi:MAG: transcriptional regulator [Chitinophagaceae bacterium]|jgi:DNA-binding transcriptional regulator GbsR (MarR family)|nr:transcriptional regulator [Chitinophagaceae bacterium]